MHLALVTRKRLGFVFKRAFLQHSGSWVRLVFCAAASRASSAAGQPSDNGGHKTNQETCAMQMLNCSWVKTEVPSQRLRFLLAPPTAWADLSSTAPARGSAFAPSSDTTWWLARLGTLLS